ncbi:MAG: HigA family addiction module antitoxin [Luteibacter sp.]
MVIDGMRRVHPGEVLREDFLVPLKLSPNALAMALRVPATRIHEIVNERRSVTAETAIRLARYFSTSAEMWMNLQSSYDLHRAYEAHGAEVDAGIKPLGAESDQVRSP